MLKGRLLQPCSMYTSSAVVMHCKKYDTVHMQQGIEVRSALYSWPPSSSQAFALNFTIQTCTELCWESHVHFPKPLPIVSSSKSAPWQQYENSFFSSASRKLPCAVGLCRRVPSNIVMNLDTVVPH